jgi:leucyl/phenylalanyl-tRNA--protein transferase
MLTIKKSEYLYIDPGIDADTLLDIIIDSKYSEDFCVSRSFSPDFIAGLMYSGFLVMSTSVKVNIDTENEMELFLLMPKHHLTRNVLFFKDLHISKTLKHLIKRDSSRYVLCVNSGYDQIVKNCIVHHGRDWLTKPLIKSMNQIRKNKMSPVRLYSFGLYRDGCLCAGEFGVTAGRVYTSYSGYHEEDSTGTIQMILTAQYLQKNNFAFWDLGMPLDYKYTLGAHDIGIEEFTRIFREGRRSNAVPS